MGELLPNFKFKGSIGDFTAYEDPTTGKITIQSKGGASAEKIHNDPGFVNTRRTNYEFRVCRWLQKHSGELWAIHRSYQITG